MTQATAEPQPNEYAFDVKMFAVIRVTAKDENTARRMLEDAMDCASINCGAWPNGDPITAEASMDGDPDLVSINDDDPENYPAGEHAQPKPNR